MYIRESSIASVRILGTNMISTALDLTHPYPRS